MKLRLIREAAELSLKFNGMFAIDRVEEADKFGSYEIVGHHLYFRGQTLDNSGAGATERLVAENWILGTGAGTVGRHSASETFRFEGPRWFYRLSYKDIGLVKQAGLKRFSNKQLVYLLRPFEERMIQPLEAARDKVFKAPEVDWRPEQSVPEDHYA